MKGDLYLLKMEIPLLLEESDGDKRERTEEVRAEEYKLHLRFLGP